MVTVSSISRGLLQDPPDPEISSSASADDVGPPSNDPSISGDGAGRVTACPDAESDADKKYVLQIKLKRHEKAAVVAAAKATFLPLATWARQIVLRGAGLGRSESIEPAVAVPQAATSDRPGRAARGAIRSRKNKRSKSR